MLNFFFTHLFSASVFFPAPASFCHCSVSPCFSIIPISLPNKEKNLCNRKTKTKGTEVGAGPRLHCQGDCTLCCSLHDGYFWNYG